MAEAQVGALAVALRHVAWRLADGSSASPPPTPSLWALVQLPRLERFWFPPDDANARASSVADFAYQQSSKALPLTRETIEALAAAQLQISVFGGDDALLGELQLPLVGVVLSEKLEERVTIPLATNSTDDTAEPAAADCQQILQADVCVQVDANLADFAAGCRVLRFRALAVLSLPTEWTLASESESDDDALRLCAAPEKNVAVYELEIRLPDVAAADHSATDVIIVTSGKLQYEPSNELSAVVAGTSAEEESGGEAAPSLGLTGSWRITFPETADDLTRVVLKVPLH